MTRRNFVSAFDSNISSYDMRLEKEGKSLILSYFGDYSVKKTYEILDQFNNTLLLKSDTTSDQMMLLSDNGYTYTIIGHEKIANVILGTGRGQTELTIEKMVAAIDQSLPFEIVIMEDTLYMKMTEEDILEVVLKA